MKRINIKVKHISNYNHQEYWLEYKDHYLIENIEQYKEYLLFLNNKFKVSESEIRNNKTFIGHGYSQLTSITGMFCGMIDDINDRTPMLAHLKMLHGNVLATQLKHILNGEKLVINTRGGYFPIKKNDEYKTYDIINNQYTEENIKINKWYGGSHFYAKIGDLDVVDNDGNVKWNTEKRAREVALQFIQTLNN